MPDNTGTHSVMLVAGEPSGDNYAAAVVRELQKTDAGIHCYGMGGQYMLDAGAELLVDSSELAVVGLVEVLAHYPALRRALRTLQNNLRDNPPDLLILVDYPDFNLRLAATAKQAGVKVLYYISPQIWAWRTNRVHKIKKLVDHMAVVFPFEVDFYRQHGIPVTYTGHPLVESAYTGLTPSEAKQILSLDEDAPVVGLFPGSRMSEIKRHLPVLLDSAKQLQHDTRDLQFIVPVTSGTHRSFIRQQLDKASLNVRITDKKIYDTIQACDAIVSASGTVTLQIALLQKPLVMIYKLSPLTYWFMKRLVKLKNFCLVNIVLGKAVVRELIQKDANANSMAKELSSLLSDESYTTPMRNELGKVRQILGDQGCAVKVSELALKLIHYDASKA